ncbi:MAG: hypothetical protein ACOY0R_11995 [Chloroflexota bacterium]
MKPKPGYWILWGVRVGLLSFLFLGLIYPSMSPAGAEGVSPPFGFSQSTTVVLNNETPSEVFLLNKTGETHTVELWLTDFNFKPLLADAEVRWPVVKLEAGSEFVTDQEPLRPLTVKLDGKQPQRILLSLNGAEQANVKPGTYTQ